MIWEQAQLPGRPGHHRRPAEGRKIQVRELVLHPRRTDLPVLVPTISTALPAPVPMLLHVHPPGEFYGTSISP